jgi:hypothetical protein
MITAEQWSWLNEKPGYVEARDRMDHESWAHGEMLVEMRWNPATSDERELVKRQRHRLRQAKAELRKLRQRLLCQAGRGL